LFGHDILVILLHNFFNGGNNLPPQKQTSMKLRKNIAISESGLLFNPVTGESFSVNPIGIEILSMIKESKTQRQIGEALLAKYSTDKITIENDYQDFIDLLSHNHLLEHNEEKDA
jgi:hypothetical protein